MGGYPPPSLFWEASEAKNCPKIAFFEKIIAQNAVNSSVFAFCGWLPWKMQSLNSSLFTVFYACVF